jgi:hypothetical protein
MINKSKFIMTAAVNDVPYRFELAWAFRLRDATGRKVMAESCNCA